MLYNFAGYYPLIPQMLQIAPLYIRIGTVDVLHRFKYVRCKFCLIRGTLRAVILSVAYVIKIE